MSRTYGLDILNKKPLYNAGFEAVGEYIQGKKTTKQSPRISLNVAPFATPFIPIELVSTDLGGIIQTCSWTKSRSVPGGSLVVTLAGDDKAIERLGIILSKPLEALWKAMGADMRDLFKPMSLCQLWIDGYHVCTGYVRSCLRQASAGNNSYEVHIDELGTLYQQNILSHDTILYGIAQHLITDVSKLYADTTFGPELWVSLSAYVNAFIASTLSYGPNVYLAASDGLPLGYRLVALPPPLGGIAINGISSINPTDISFFKYNGGGSFWDFIKQFAPSPYMEMFTESGGRTICIERSFPEKIDTGVITKVISSAIPVPTVPGLGIAALMPGFNYIICRTSPYDIPWTGLSLWYQLYKFTLGVLDLILAGDFIIVTDDDIISKNLGISDKQQYTVFHADYGAKASSGDATKVKNRPSISNGPTIPFFSGGLRSFGAREFRAAISMTSLQNEGIASEIAEKLTNTLETIPSLSTLLNVWFRNNGKFNEGEITTRAFPYARPGMCLLYLPSLSGSKVDNNRDIGLYYIDNMQYQYNIGAPPTTTFSLIRGVPIPMSSSSLAMLLMDWEVLPPGMNLADLF